MTSDQKTTLSVPATSSHIPNDTGSNSGCHRVWRKNSLNETPRKKVRLSLNSTRTMRTVVIRETAAQSVSNALMTISPE